MSYLQLPVKRKEENCFCTRCGEMGYGRCYCQVTTWCKFCTSDTHAMQACRKYEKFVNDNAIASSRRSTPVQEQRITVNTQEPTKQPLFPHPPVQHFNPTVIPHMTTNTLGPQGEERDSKEHSRKSPQNQMKEVRTPMSKQLLHQRSCQDVCMDPRYQKQTPTVCRDKLSPTLFTDTNRSKRNRPCHSTRCDTTSGTETYAIYRWMTKRINSSCQYTTDSECT